ncbi:MAG: protein kinase, partial [Chloroflexi bacterium]|nr:protein kinase [Chloroflexota bacterium]
LADFGIAKDLIASETGQTTGGVIGSLDYIAPEQARGETITPRTDIYSLGVLLYELLTGEHPFGDISSVERLYKHLNDPLPTIANPAGDISAGINDVIQRATAKNPAQRYPDVAALALAFRQASGRDVSATSLNIIEQLTWREQEVLQLIAEGRSNKEIADKLYVTLATVRWHLRQVYKKLGARSRVQAVVRARELDLLVSGEADLQPTSPTATLVALPEPENPYKGLRAFEAADARDFFGRETLTAKLIQRLAETDRFRRFLAVIGPSGSGKSSLVKAGLIPALWTGALPGSERWFVAEMTPGSRPIDQLEVALVRVAAHYGEALGEQLTRDPHGLLRAADIILPHDSTELILVIDQFEEVFTLVDDEHTRQQFLDLLTAAVTDPRSRVRVIVTLRADYYHRPLQYPDFGELVRSRMETILPLSVSDLERAIVYPAEAVGVRFAEGLVAAIVEDVHYQPGALPLLQYALTELFEHRQERLLTQQAYQEIGGAVGALAKRAEQLYADLTPPEQEITQQIFLRLVTTSETTEAARRRIRRAELLSLALDAEDMNDLIDTFADHRLLTLDHDVGTRSPTVEVAHEAILREWPRLSTWISESREDINMRQQIERNAQEWQEKSKEISYLASGQRLTQFEDWAGAKRQALSALEHAYLEASLAERAQQQQIETARQQRETKLERRSRRFLRGLVVMLLLATLGAFGLTAIAQNARQDAEKEASLALLARQQAEDQARIATARELVGYATNTLNTDAELSTLLAIQAVKTTYDVDATVLPEANTILHQAVQALNPPLHIDAAQYPPGWTMPFSFSPDNKRIIYPLVVHPNTGMDEQTAIADANTGEVLYMIEGEPIVDSAANDRFITFSIREEGMVLLYWDIASLERGTLLQTIPLNLASDWEWIDMTPDLHSLVTYSPSRDTQVFDLTTGEEITTSAAIRQGANNYPGFSPDGRYLITENPNGSVSVTDTTTWNLTLTLKPAGTQIAVYNQPFRFSFDGTHMVTANRNNTASVWDLSTGNEQVFDSGFAPKIVALNRDGTRLLTGTPDGEAIIWDTTTEEALMRLSLGKMDRANFSPDGSMLGANHGSGSLKIWSLISGQEFKTMITSGVDRDSGPVGLAYSPDGKRLVAASVTETPIVWDAETGEKIFTLTGHTDRVKAVAWSPDGTHIASAGDDTNVILWDADSGEKRLTFSGHTYSIYGLAFSPDGSKLASSSIDQTVQIWDVASGKLLFTLNQIAHSKGVAWSPDGTRIAAGTDIADDNNGYVQVWDAATGKSQLGISVGASRTGMISFSPDGKQLLASTLEAQGASVFDAQTGEKLLTLTNNVNIVSGVAYNRDGTQIATSSHDGTTRLWDAASGQELLTLYGPAEGTARVAFSPDGKHLATENEDGTTRIYILDIDELIALAQSRLTRTWTVAECQRYLHTDICPV